MTAGPPTFWQWQLRRRRPYTAWGDYIWLVGTGRVQPPPIASWQDLQYFAKSAREPFEARELRQAWASYASHVLYKRKASQPSEAPAEIERG